MIVFFHFHKAGGSSMLSAAQQAHLTLPIRHANGHPRNARGDLVRPWEWPPREVQKYVVDMQTAGVDFLSFEWGFPDVAVLKQVPGVEVWTILRDPFSRIVSNYNFDRVNGFTNALTFDEYCNGHLGDFTRDNYYSKALVSAADIEFGERPTVLQLLSDRLQYFDNIGVLEDQVSLSRFMGRLGGPSGGGQVPHEKKSSSSSSLRRRLWRAMRAGRRGRIDLVPKHIQRRAQEFDVIAWKSRNEYDYFLYNLAKEGQPDEGVA